MSYSITIPIEISLVMVCELANMPRRTWGIGYLGFASLSRVFTVSGLTNLPKVFSFFHFVEPNVYVARLVRVFNGRARGMRYVRYVVCIQTSRKKEQKIPVTQKFALSRDGQLDNQHQTSLVRPGFGIVFAAKRCRRSRRPGARQGGQDPILCSLQRRKG